MKAKAFILDLETYPTRDRVLIEKLIEEAKAKEPPSGISSAAELTWHSEAARLQRAQVAWEKTGLDPLLAEILVAGVAVDDREPVAFTAMRPDEPEAQMLAQLADYVRRETDEGTIWIVFNGLAFDFPILTNRSRRHQIEFPSYFPRARHGRVSGKVLDLMHRVPSKNGRGMVGLEAALAAYGLSSPKGMVRLRDGRPLSGKLVRDAYDLGEWGAIWTYCLEDIKATRGLYLAMGVEGEWGDWAPNPELDESIEEIWGAGGVSAGQKASMVLKVLADMKRIPRWWAGLERRLK